MLAREKEQRREQILKLKLNEQEEKKRRDEIKRQEKQEAEAAVRKAREELLKNREET